MGRKFLLKFIGNIHLTIKILNMSPTQARKRIRLFRGIIDNAYYQIRELARQEIPDFHFMDHEVSTFWTCDSSPLGMCVFNLDEMGRKTVCRYCGKPTERK